MQFAQFFQIDFHNNILNIILFFFLFGFPSKFKYKFTTKIRLSLDSGYVVSCSRFTKMSPIALQTMHHIFRNVTNLNYTIYCSSLKCILLDFICFTWHACFQKQQCSSKQHTSHLTNFTVTVSQPKKFLVGTSLFSNTETSIRPEPN